MSLNLLTFKNVLRMCVCVCLLNGPGTSCYEHQNAVEFSHSP